MVEYFNFTSRIQIYSGILICIRARQIKSSLYESQIMQKHQISAFHCVQDLKRKPVIEFYHKNIITR